MSTSTVTFDLSDLSPAFYGTIKIWASEPIANGKYQGAPPFEQTILYNGDPVSVELTTQEPGQSWYYICHFYPTVDGRMSTQGATQARFYLPPQLEAYDWTGTPNNSSSTKSENGVLVATNIAPDPKATDPAKYRSTGTVTIATAGGVPCLKATRATDGSLQVVPDVKYYPNIYDLQVGDVVTWSVDVYVTTPMNIQLIVLFYSGANEDTVADITAQTPAQGWVRHYATSTITATPAGGYFEYRLHSQGANVPAGQGYYFKNLQIQNNTTEPYFDGDSPDVPPNNLTDLMELYPAW